MARLSGHNAVVFLDGQRLDVRDVAIEFTRQNPTIDAARERLFFDYATPSLIIDGRTIEVTDLQVVEGQQATTIRANRANRQVVGTEGSMLWMPQVPPLRTINNLADLPNRRTRYSRTPSERVARDSNFRKE